MKLLAWALGVVVSTLAFFDVTVHERTIYTCLLCRAEKTSHRSFGQSWVTERDTEFTGWYARHGGIHAHRWTRCSCTRGSNLFGQPTRWACGQNHPIGLLQPRIEREFAERADPADWKAFMDGVLSSDRKIQQGAVDAAVLSGIKP